jgi:beta-lactamase superfamily II metal-dependent hydrolase
MVLLMPALRLFVVVVACMVCACGPSLLKVAPAEAGAGAEVEIFGTGLPDAATARLELGGANVQLVVTDAASSSLKARVPQATPAGVYDVVVEAGGAELRLPAALTVVEGVLRIQFLDVGQGDATLITGPDGQNMLIDGGPRAGFDVVKEAVDAVGGVDHVAVTHTDADHLNGVVELLSGNDGEPGTNDDIVPETRWIGHDDVDCDSQLCGDLRALKGDFVRPLVGDLLEFGDATVEVVGRDADFGGGALAGATDPNERSLTVVVHFGGRSVFIGGDLTGGGLDSANVEALAGDVVGPVDVLRVNHHGSQTSSSAGFLAALQPIVAVISEGTDNAYCHPSAEALRRVAAAGPAIFSTGVGMTESDDSCEATDWPVDAAVGVGTIELVITADGALSVDGVAF